MKIIINHLSHVYDKKNINEFTALDNVSFETSPKGITAFIGHNGSGKTTLIKHINALLFPTSGSIEINDLVIAPLPKPKRRIKNIVKYRKNVGMVFQFPEEQFFAETVREEIIFGTKALKIRSDNMDQKIRNVLRLVGLDESFIEKNPFELSGGQKRRIALASILIQDQDLLILDEPTASLDNKGATEIYNLIKNLAQQGKKIIIVTHDLQNVIEYTDEVVVFANAKIIAKGDPLDILYDTALLHKHNLEVPKLVKVYDELHKRNINIPKIKNINELTSLFREKN